MDPNMIIERREKRRTNKQMKKNAIKIMNDTNDGCGCASLEDRRDRPIRAKGWRRR